MIFKSPATQQPVASPPRPEYDGWYPLRPERQQEGLPLRRRRQTRFPEAPTTTGRAADGTDDDGISKKRVKNSPNVRACPRRILLRRGSDHERTNNDGPLPYGSNAKESGPALERPNRWLAGPFDAQRRLFGAPRPRGRAKAKAKRRGTNGTTGEGGERGGGRRKSPRRRTGTAPSS